MKKILCFYFLYLLVGILIFFIGSNIVLAAKNIATNVPNTVTGTMGDDKMYGLNGKDNLYGLGGNDALQGDNGDDFVDGGQGKDSLEGNDGNDIVQGGAGADKIDGGKGNDTLIASFALGTISFRDYSADSVVCGPGYDTAFINPVDGDTASDDCEVIVAETSQ